MKVFAMFVSYLAKHCQAIPSKGNGVPHKQNTRGRDSPSLIKGDLSPPRKGQGLLDSDLSWGSILLIGPYGPIHEPICWSLDPWSSA
ncbi:hypothetical protein GBA52_003709 [Prunus armeniaca]|nr:hypothetical protein GBA52_003709 [Prunus armeniaca]